MRDNKDNELEFVTHHYKEGKFSPEKAIRRFHSSKSHYSQRRWWVAAAALFAGVFILFAGGYGVYSIINHKSASLQPVEQVDAKEDASHIFVFEDAPLSEVLEELSEFYGRKLTASPTEKHLSGSFPDDDIEVIVEAIEEALDITIKVGE